MKLSELGERIKSRRKDKGLTQDDLAEKLGMNDNTSISKWERYNPENNKGTQPKLENLQRLADALGCDPEFFLGSCERPHVSTQWIAEQIPLDEDVIELLIDLKTDCDKNPEFDPINHESHMKALLLKTIVKYILTPIENPPLGQPTPEELLNLSRNYFENFETIKQEGGSHARKHSKKWSDADQAMKGIEFTIGYRLGRIIGNGLRGWFSDNH